MVNLTSYFKDTSQELKRVSWPSIDELKESTIVVLVTVGVITVLLFVVDKVLDLGMKAIISLA